MSDEMRTGRREFFRTALRYALFAAMGAGAALLFRRGRRGPKDGEDCINTDYARDLRCQGCTVLGTCGLPDALRARGETRRS